MSWNRLRVVQKINLKEDFIILHQPVKVDMIKAKSNLLEIAQLEKHQKKPLSFTSKSKVDSNNIWKESKEALLEKAYWNWNAWFIKMINFKLDVSLNECKKI